VIEVRAVINRPRLAIVEDGSFMAQLVSDMPTSGGHCVDVEVFMLGTDMLNSTDLLKFKTIILDLSLPDIDCFVLVDNLAECNIGMSIVVMRGHDRATLRAAELYGNVIGLKVLGKLTKPFTQGDLFAALRVAG
jgi:FixJ family two-component response regulator